MPVTSALRDLTPPVIWRGLKRISSGLKNASQNAPQITIEEIDYHANTSNWTLEHLRGEDDLRRMKVLSITARVAHLADYVALFERVYHVTMIPPQIPFIYDRHRLVVVVGDFFEMGPTDIDCVMSHVTVHCLSDTRYGNESAFGEEGMRRPYQFAEHLRKVIGSRRVPTFVSIAVNRDEGQVDNDRWLSHEKFLNSFQRHGFELKDHYFDYMCATDRQRQTYQNLEFRRAATLPVNQSDINYVIGCYYFT